MQYQSEFDKIFYNFKKQEYQIKKDYEEIDITHFGNQGIKQLSFNLNNTSTYEFNSAIPYTKYPNPGNWSGDECCFLAGNRNTIYLKKDLYTNSTFDTPYSYTLNSLSTNNFDNINNFLTNSAITHNPVTIYGLNDSTMHLSHIGYENSFKSFETISNPIIDFGFPFDKRYRPRDENNDITLDLSNYIKEPFILEKVYVEFGLQNFSISNTLHVPCFNVLNFFIVNQRGSISGLSSTQYDNYFGSANNNLNTIKYYNNASNQLDTLNTTFERDTTLSNTKAYTRAVFKKPFLESEVENSFAPQESNFYINSPGSKIFPEIVGGTGSQSGYIDNRQREVISSIKIANIGYKTNINGGIFPLLAYKWLDITNDNSSKINNSIDKIIFSDFSHTDYSNWDGNTVHDVCINSDFQKVKILSKVKSYKDNKNLKRFSNFEIYPRQKSNRAGLPFTSEKSYNSENNISSDTSNIDRKSEKIDLGNNESHIENPYVLYPEDSLFFGFNISTSLNLSSEDLTSTNKYQDLTGRDVVLLDLRDLKIKLIGRYITENKVTNIKNKDYENKNIKKINEFATNVVDKFGLPLFYMLNGTYYDRFNTVSSNLRSFAYNLNIPPGPESPIGFAWPNFFGVTTEFIEEVTISEFRQLDDIATPQYQPKKYLYYRFGVDHFGFLSDKFNENKHYAYINVQTGKITRNIKKIFRKNGFLKEKVLNTDTFNSYNTDRYASLEDDNIWFKEIP